MFEHVARHRRLMSEILSQTSICFRFFHFERVTIRNGCFNKWGNTSWEENGLSKMIYLYLTIMSTSCMNLLNSFCYLKFDWIMFLANHVQSTYFMKRMEVSEHPIYSKMAVHSSWKFMKYVMFGFCTISIWLGSYWSLWAQNRHFEACGVLWTLQFEKCSAQALKI